MIFNFDESHVIHYEIFGEGQPLLMLNGIMMSTESWSAFTKQLANNHQLILVDFLDQGKSSNYESAYQQELQVKVVIALLDHLKLTKVNVFGISYGGEIALHVAANYPSRVNRLLLFNTCIETTYWLEEIGNAWNQAIGDPLSYYLTSIPYIYSLEFFSKNRQWVEARKQQLLPVFASEQFGNRMRRLTNSAVGYSLVNEVEKITQPTLIIGCEDDFITPLKQQRELNKLLINSELVIIPNSGHAIMYEKPNVFAMLILGFLHLQEDIVI